MLLKAKKKLRVVFKKEKNVFLLILAIGFFLRVYKPAQLFMYSHDNDLAGWFVRDVVVNKHLRLIGQETSTQGIFIGPLYYYLLIPFYLLFRMDPIGGVVMITILGLFSIGSVYFVFSEVFSRKEGLISSFLYAISFYTVFNDREVVPTMPVIVWTVWFFYGLNLLLKGEQKKGFLILGILVGLIWHLNMALALLIPLIPLSIYLSKKKVDIRKLFYGSIVLVLMLPLILFELRHGFLQSRWFVNSLTTNQQAIISGYEQFKRVILLLSKNASGLIWGSFDILDFETTLIILVITYFVLIAKKKILKEQALIIFFWLILYIVFFSLYSKNLSEYYLNGTIIVWIYILTLGISYLLSRKALKDIGIASLVIFSILNLNKFVSLEINKSGYLERKAVVQEIKKNAEEHRYPCVAVSYITKPGYNFGYRYFFFLEEMHVNRPESGSPVYSIVFPLRQDIKVDKTFGAIGLIYPEYSRYTEKNIEVSCAGENSNLTDPMWGFTQ